MVCLFFSICVACLIRLAGFPSFPPEAVRLEGMEGRPAVIQGRVVNKQTKQNKLILYLSDVTFCDEQISNQIKARGAVCYLNPIEKTQHEPNMGSRVRVAGETESFQGALNPGEFDYRSYMLLEGYDFFLNSGTVLWNDNNNTVNEFLYRIRKRLEGVLENSLPSGEAGIMKAMLLGNKEGLEPESKELYRINGIAHILAISGLHISLLGMGLFRILNRCGLPLKITVPICIVFLFLYGQMTGMSSSAFRAVIMFTLQLSARFLLRSYDMLTAVSVAAAIVTAVAPLSLFQTGFQLSFGAVLGIALITPRFPRISFGPGRAFLASLSVQLMTLPVLLTSYYEFPLYSLLLNLIIIPLMSVAAGSGLLAILLGLFFPAAGCAAALPALCVLKLYEFLCIGICHMPFYTFIVGCPEPWKAVVYYFLLGLGIAVAGKRKDQKKKGISGGQKIAFVLWGSAVMLLFTAAPPGKLQISILDVGQGDAICIRAPDGTTILVDGGSSSKKNVGTKSLLPWLKYQGIKTVDYIFLSHMDEDHISGIEELMLKQEERTCGVNFLRLVVPPSAKDEEAWKRISAAAARGKTKLYEMKRFDRIEAAGLTIACLYPETAEAKVKGNAGSMVLSLTYGEFDMLLTGDLEGEGEKALCQYLSQLEQSGKGKDYEVLKVAHHGSKNSTQTELLSLLRAEIALISCGKDNRYGHPHRETTDRLKQAGMEWCATMGEGALMIETDGRAFSLGRFTGRRG